MVNSPEKQNQAESNVTIEQLQQEVGQTQQALDLLKKDAQSPDKQQKTEAMQTQISMLKGKLTEALQKETDEAKKQQISDLQKQLETTSSELANLAQTVSTNSNQSSQNPNQKDKGFLAKTGDFISENVNAVASADTWKKETGMNILRTAGFAAAWYAAWSGIKGVWNWMFGDKDEEEKEENSDSEDGETPKKKDKKEKKGFWKSGFGQVLKWTGITGAVGTAGYYLGKYYGRWGKEAADATSSSSTQATNTEHLKEENPERFKKYQGMGINIDAQYNQLMKKELDAGWWGMSIADGYIKYIDKTNLSKDDFLATVPMCVDNEFNSVDNLLSEGGYYGYLREKNFQELKDFILGKGSEWISKIMGPYLVKLTSFIPFVWDNWTDSVKKWLESGKPEEREEEMKLFFRQYAKVISYVQDKRAKLVEQIVQEKMKTVGENFSTVEDAIDDEEWFEKYIATDGRYKNFMGGKLHQAVDVMQSEKIFDGQLSERMKMQMASADAERDVILKNKDWKDALQRAIQQKENLTPETNREGLQVCKDVNADLEENFDKSWTYLYFGSLHTAINSETKNIQEFMKESGLNALKAWIQESLKHYEELFTSGKMTSQDVENYKNLVNSYFAMKKEVLIGAKSIQQMKSDNASFTERALNIWSAAVGDLWQQTKAALSSFKDENRLTWWGQLTLPLIVWGSAVSLVGKWKGNTILQTFGRYIRTSDPFHVVRNMKGKIMRRVWAKDLNWSPGWLLRSRYNIPNGDQLLFQDIIEGKVNGKSAQKILSKGNDLWKIGHGKRGLSDFLKTMAAQEDSVFPAAKIEMLFNNKYEIAFMKNESLRKMFFRLDNTQSRVVWSIINGYRKKVYVPYDMPHLDPMMKFLLGDNWVIPPYMKLSDEQKLLFKQICESGHFTKIDELYHVINNIDKVDVKGVDLKKVTRLADELAETLSDFADVNKLRSKTAQSISQPLDGLSDAIDHVAKDTAVYKRVSQDFDQALDILENDLKKEMSALSDPNQLSPKAKQLQKKIWAMSDFRDAVLKKTEKEIAKSEELLTIFKKGSNLSHAAEQLHTLSKLEGQKFISDVLDSKTGKQLEKSFDDVIKTLDDAAIRALKGKNTGIADEALEALADTFKAAKAQKQVRKNADEVLVLIKSAFKFFSKLT